MIKPIKILYTINLPHKMLITVDVQHLMASKRVYMLHLTVECNTSEILKLFTKQTWTAVKEAEKIRGRHLEYSCRVILDRYSRTL